MFPFKKLPNNFPKWQQSFICEWSSFSTHSLVVCIATIFILIFLIGIWASVVAQTVKNPPAMQETDLIPGLGRFPGEGKDYPLQYSCLKKFMDSGAWWAVVQGVAKSQTQLSDQAHSTTGILWWYSTVI